MVRKKIELLMGFNSFLIFVCFIFLLSRSIFVQGMDQRYNSDSLNVYLHSYTYTKVVRPRTGVLYHVSLPSNFSGIEISFARFRFKSFYNEGVNFSSFDIPPSTSPSPFSKRFDAIYENLGNWSSYYFNIANYTLVSPVVGLSLYNSTNPSGTKSTSLSLHIKGRPVIVYFPRISLPNGETNATKQCVRFGTNGSVEITKMTSPNICISQQDGHFAVAIRSILPYLPPRRKKNKFWKWWVIGFGVGVVGLAILVIFGVLVYKFVKRRRIVKMEKETERSEVLGTTWIGNSRMPSALGIRTQPVLITEDGP